MKLPRLASVAANRTVTDVFGGYNHNLRISDSEFYDMKNMTSDYYPVLSPRKKRGVWLSGNNINGIVSNNGLCYVRDSIFVLPDGTEVDIGLSDGVKNMVSMGAYVIILPDKKWVNVAACLDEIAKGEDVSWGSYGNVEEILTTTVNVELCRDDGTVYDRNEIAEKKPTEPEEGKLWMDIDGEKPVLKRWSSEVGMWAVVRNVYTRLSFLNIAGQPFKKGDTVTVSVKKGATEAPLGDILGDWYVRGAGYDEDDKCEYLILDAQVTADVGGATLTVSKTIPDMDYVVESGNRLWGCKYGSTEDGFLNEIYASKLGDFKNWKSFQGVSTDSYRASIGADGAFTGAVSYGGRPIFFKENCMIEVYGAYPAQYQVQATTCNGVQNGCEKSLAIVNNILFYKSGAGVCAFDGSLPTVISADLGEVEYGNAVAGGAGNKYYITMRSEDGWALFVYDTKKGMWHKEDDLCVLDFVSHGNGLYGLSKDRGAMIAMVGNADGDVEWMVQSGNIGITLPDAKYVTRLTVRMSLSEDSEVSFYVQYDFEEEWIDLCTIPGTSLRSFDIPIRPKRCDHMKLRIEGVGDAKIYSITKTIEQGSDVM